MQYGLLESMLDTRKDKGSNWIKAWQPKPEHYTRQRAQIKDKITLGTDPFSLLTTWTNTFTGTGEKGGIEFAWMNGCIGLLATVAIIASNENNITTSLNYKLGYTCKLQSHLIGHAIIYAIVEWIANWLKWTKIIRCRYSTTPATHARSYMALGAILKIEFHKWC